MIELVVVIVIIGIIGAIAIPRMSRGAEGAAESALRVDLRIVRDAIQLYREEHNGTFPGVNGDGTSAAGTRKAFQRQLTQYSDINGLTSATKSPSFPFGPYLRAFPPGPLGPAKGDTRINMKSIGTPLSGRALPSRAWKFDTITGEFIFNYDDVSSEGTPYDEW